MKKEINDLMADQECMSVCVSAFEKLSRHHYTLGDSDSVAIAEGGHARIRVLQWLIAYIQEHKYL